MNPREVASKRFEKGFGYKQEDVDSFLKEIALEYANAVREKEESEAKIVKLVEKINEYRSDENAIGNALLVAQKQGNRIIAEAQAEAAKIVSEAQAKRDAMISEIAGDCETVKRTQIEKIALAIKDENERLNSVVAASAEKTEQAKEQLYKLKAEITDFKLKLLSVFEEQIKLTAELPEISEAEIEKIINGEVKPTTYVAPAPATAPAPVQEAVPAAAQADKDNEAANINADKSEKPTTKAAAQKPVIGSPTFTLDFGSDIFDPSKNSDSSFAADSLAASSFGFSEIDYKKQNHSYGDLKFGQNSGNKGKK